MPLVDDDSPQVRFPPPLIYFGCLLLGLWAGRTLEWPVLVGAWPQTLGWVLVGLGSVLIGAALGWFFSAGTNPEPWKRDSALVTKGFYRITRNPMYLGMAFASFGIALVFGSFGAMIGTVVAVLREEDEAPLNVYVPVPDALAKPTVFPLINALLIFVLAS